jgi:uncharacterized protein (TIGR03083 family)
VKDPGALYRDQREQFTRLVLSADAEDLERRVPATPDWTLRELTAHVTGIANDFLAGDVDDAGKPEWTARQVSDRSDRSIEALVEEWSGIAAELEPALDTLPPRIAYIIIADLTSHKFDAFNLFDKKDDRDSPALLASLEFYVPWFGKRLKDEGLPTLEVIAGEESWHAGREEPVGTLRAVPFELFRSLGGRRTRDEVKSLDWGVSPEPYLEIFTPYTYRETSLGE